MSIAGALREAGWRPAPWRFMATAAAAAHTALAMIASMSRQSIA
jgi:hypothetical protein